MKYFLVICSIIISAIADNRPNIIFMMADDQGWDGLSVQMHPEIKESKHSYIQTPVLEKMAKEGMRFSSAYAPSPVCSPTRISLQTGKSPAALHWTKAAKSISGSHNFKLLPPRNIKALSESETTIGEILQKAGYKTAHFGKWHINGGGPGKHGYDVHDGDIGNEYAFNYKDPNPADIYGMAKRACNFMESAKKDGKPFFIQMSFHALHAPQNAMKDSIQKYEKLATKGNEKEIGRAALSENLDTGVGIVLKHLNKLGLDKKTYVIYMSDNGAGGKKGILRGGKGDAWEGGIRSPMIVRGPGIKENSWCHQRVVGYDWYPTFCHWAGIENLPQGLEGGDLSKVLKDPLEGKIIRPRNELVFHFPHYQGDTPHTALISGNWKLIKFYETNEYRLFNLGNDISEKNNLASIKPEVTASLKEKMITYLNEINAQMPSKNPDYDPNKESTPLKGKKGNKKDKKKKK